MIKVTFDNGETYTEKEFQRDLHRYFKTLNVIASYLCKTFGDCKKCMLYKDEVCGKSYVNAKPIKYSFEIIEAVYKRAKEHPAGTNRDKFIEVFGNNPPINTMYGFVKWLDEEYKGPKGEKQK